MNHSLNHVFRLVWNHRLGTWCVAPEIARGKGKTKNSTQGHPPATRCIPLLLLLGSTAAWAELPQGGQVSAGQGQLNYQGNTLHVQQHSDKLALDWQSFSVGKDNKVIFNQPGAQSVALNRVLGADVSRIQGAIKANGQVFLLNPNGVLFSPTAQVNTGGLVASTLELSNDDFMAGNFQFEGDSAAAVTNQGEINVAEGGTIALIAATLVNEGSLQATSGNVLMGAGRKVTLDMGGPVKLRVDEGALNTLIEQGGAIRADGGRVYLTAGAAGKLATSVINHTGITRAQTLATGENGEIVLLGDMQQGQLQVAGTLDASAPAADGPNGDGGFIETSAAKVQINDSVQVTTLAENGTAGEWLIDPTDFTINAGSDALTDSGIGAATLSANLENNNVTLATVDGGTEAGDMYVNGAVSWNADHTLSLNAHNNIHINEAITATNGGLTLNAGGNISADGAVNVGTFNLQSGAWSQLGSSLADFTAKDFRLNTANARFLRANSGDGSEGNAYQIFDLYGLQGIASRSLLSSHFALSNDIDASGTATWNGGAGFVPIGDWSNRYTSSFDGQGHSINGLTINRPNTDYVGLFGVISASQISNVGLTNATITGQNVVGGLVGNGTNSSGISHSSVQGDIVGTSGLSGGLAGTFSGTIEHSHSSGTVYSGNRTGGLVGDMSGQITDSYSNSSVEGSTEAGGLVGYNQGGTISNAYATGSVRGSSMYVGGLVGSNRGTISSAYATGSVKSSRSRVGGLVGYNRGTISNAYATGSVEGTTSVGGLVGSNGIVTISNAYATGSVKGSDSVGGLVGRNSGTISNAYATGSVEGSGTVGGLAGTGGTITNSYWNTDTSGQASAVGDGRGDGTTSLTTAQMFDAANFSGFDFADTWANADDQTTPYLRDLAGNRVFNKNDLPTGTIDATNRPALYTVIQNVEQLQAMRDDVSANYLLGNPIDASATASWNGGAGFVPIGDLANLYAGSFDGLGHTLSNLTIDRSSTDYVGLFGATASGSVIRDIGLVGGSVSGRNYVGGLVGYNSSGTISNAYATGSVEGSGSVGGLVGLNAGTISNAYATGSVEGYRKVGGLVGYTPTGTIGNAYATGSVEGSGSVGGLVGHNYFATISNAYATGSVEGRNYVGGLVGFNESGTISNAYATGSVKGSSDFVGGLVGFNVSGTSNSYWNTNTSGQANAVGGGSSTGITGLTTAQIMQADSFTGWDIDAQGGTGTVWRIYEGYTAPLLRHFLTALEVTGDDTSVTYNGTEQSGSWSATGEYDANRIFGQVSGGGRNAGTYNINMSGLYSDQQGYDLITTNGTLTINKANLTVTAQNASKTYDGLAYSGGNGVSYDGFVIGEDASVLSGTLTYGGNAQGAINAGDYTLSASGLTSNNYAINYVDGTLTIGKGMVDLMISAKDAFKVYDGEAWFGGNGIDVDGLAAGETLADLDGTLVWGGSAQGAVNAGDYTITASGLSSPNYKIRFNNGTLTIGKASLTVAAQNASKTYDGLAWSGNNGVSYNGFVKGEDVSVLNGTLSWGGTAEGAVNAGNYTLTASGLSSNNYNINFVDGTLNIGKASLTVAAQNASKTYDGLAWSGNNGVIYSGFVAGENTDVLSGTLTYGGSAQGAVNAGNYTLSASGLSSNNYNINFVDGTLNIGKAPLTIAAQNASKTYDGQAWSGNNGVSYNGFVNGEEVSVLNGSLSWGGTAEGAVNAGNYTLTPSGLGADNYDINFVDGTLTIDKANLMVTAQDALWVQDGSGWSGGNGISYEGFVNGEDASVLQGDLLWGGSAQGAEMPGDYTLSASGLSADNYQLTFIDGQLRIISPMEAAGQPYQNAVQQAQHIDRAPRPIRYTQLAYANEPLKVVSTGIRLP